MHVSTSPIRADIFPKFILLGSKSRHPHLTVRFTPNSSFNGALVSPGSLSPFHISLPILPIAGEIETEAAPMANALPPRKQPPSHPSYAEMICSAIKALNERQGSSQKAIAKYIASTYVNLPQTHASLLSTHLKRLKNKGLVLMVKHSYKLPKSPNLKLDDDNAVKRGRGRPPKPKPGNPTQVNGGLGLAKKGRGRPPKPKPAAAAVLGRKPRGRPKKEVAAVVAGTPKPRGRPPKKAKEGAGTDSAVTNGGTAVSPRSRGRPRKAEGKVPKSSTGRPRGRPRKLVS